MDFHSCVITLYSVFLVCLLATGLARAQWSDDEVDEVLSDLQMDGTSSEAADYEPVRFTPGMANSEYGNPLANLLKRSEYAGNYRRLPRIKQQRIIPFYSYGSDYGRLRSSPRYHGRTIYPYYYTPWNTETYRPASYLNKQIYANFKRK